MHIISISRGSYGASKSLADILSQKLNTPIFTREDVIGEAEKYGIKETGLVAYNFAEKAPGVWEKSSFRCKHYLLSFLTAFLDIAVQGSIIYVGHLVHILLPGIPFLLRVRIVQSNENRIKILMDENHMDHEQAVNYIKTVDERRLKWSEFLYGVNIENPVYYDLIINLDKMYLKTASEMIILAAAKAEFQSNAESLRSLKNFHLATKARLYLHLSPLTRGSEFEVEADSEKGFLIVCGECPYVDDDRCEQKVKTVLSKLEGVNRIEYTKVARIERYQSEVTM